MNPEDMFDMMRPIMQAIREATDDVEAYGMGFVMYSKDDAGALQMERLDPRRVIISPDVDS